MMLIGRECCLEKRSMFPIHFKVDRAKLIQSHLAWTWAYLYLVATRSLVFVRDLRG